MNSKHKFKLTPLWAAVGLVGVAFLLVLYFLLRGDGITESEGANGAPVLTAGNALVGGPFKLTDQSGKTVSDTDFRGRYMLIYFGFTFCPIVCPTELQAISAAMDALGQKADKVAPIFITIDPERDTVQVLSTYVKQFHPKLVGLTGTPDQIRAVARDEYKVYYAKVEDPTSSAGYTFDHFDAVFLMGPDGKFVTFFPPGTTPEKMAARIEQAMDGK
jgi:protein SCO1/2